MTEKMIANKIITKEFGHLVKLLTLGRSIQNYIIIIKINQRSFKKQSNFEENLFW